MLILVRVRIQCYIIDSLGTIGLFLVELCIQWIKKKRRNYDTNKSQIRKWRDCRDLDMRQPFYLPKYIPVSNRGHIATSYLCRS